MGLTPPENVVIATPTKNDTAERLIGYVKVPAEMWEHIPNFSHIRYFDKQGRFITSGFFLNISHDVNNAPNRFMVCYNGKSHKSNEYYRWKTYLNNIEVVFKKMEVKNIIETTLLKYEIERLDKKIRDLEQIISRISIMNGGNTKK
jgi:hypothetical protein